MIVKNVPSTDSRMVCPLLAGNTHASLSNILLNGSFPFSNTEALAILLSLGGVNSTPTDNPETDAYRKSRVYAFSTKDYAALKNLDARQTYRTFLAAAESIFKKHFVVFPSKTNRDKVLCRWVSEVHAYADADRIGFVYSPTVYDFIFNLTGDFTRLNTLVSLTIEGKHPRRLFMLLEQQRFRGLVGQAGWGIEELYECFGATEAAREAKVFFKDIFNPSVAALKEVGYLDECEVRKVKAGRNISGVELDFVLASQEKFAEVYRADLEHLAKLKARWGS